MPITQFEGKALVFNNGVVDVQQDGVSVVDENKIAHITPGEVSIDELTIIKNADNELEVPFDNDTIYRDPSDGFIKAKNVSEGRVNEMIDIKIAGKQDTLTAGTNITIDNNVISATGGGSGGLDSEGVKSLILNEYGMGKLVTRYIGADPISVYVGDNSWFPYYGEYDYGNEEWTQGTLPSSFTMNDGNGNNLIIAMDGSMYDDHWYWYDNMKIVLTFVSVEPVDPSGPYRRWKATYGLNTYHGGFSNTVYLQFIGMPSSGAMNVRLLNEAATNGFWFDVGSYNKLDPKFYNQSTPYNGHIILDYDYSETPEHSVSIIIGTALDVGRFIKMMMGRMPWARTVPDRLFIHEYNGPMGSAAMMTPEIFPIAVGDTLPDGSTCSESNTYRLDGYVGRNLRAQIWGYINDDLEFIVQGGTAQ